MGDKEEKSSEPVIGKAPGHQYDAKSIRVLGGIEAVRLRPAMYIGSTGEMGLHHLVWEVVDNSVDEAMAGHADEINVTVHADDSVTVVDNGRGIPVDMHATEKRPAAEVVLTVLHAGGKFDSETYKVSGGLHGVGVSVVNALSDWLELEISRDGGVWEQTYEKGNPTSKLKQTGKTRKTGTKVTFHPDPSIFDKTTYSFDTLAQRLRELAFLNKGLKITLTDERTEKSTEFRFTGGIGEFVKHLNRGKTTLHDSIHGVSLYRRHRRIRQAPESRQDDAARFAHLHRRQARERRDRNRAAIQRYLRRKCFCVCEHYQYGGRRHAPFRISLRTNALDQQFRLLDRHVEGAEGRSEHQR